MLLLKICPGVRQSLPHATHLHQGCPTVSPGLLARVPPKMTASWISPIKLALGPTQLWAFDSSLSSPVLLVPKTQSLCSGAQLNLGDRILGEVEKNSFFALPGKRGIQRACAPEKLHVSIWRDLVKIFIAVVQGLICLGHVQGLHPFNLVSDGLLWKEDCCHLAFLGGFSFINSIKILLCVSLGSEPPQVCSTVS